MTLVEGKNPMNGLWTLTYSTEEQGEWPLGGVLYVTNAETIVGGDGGYYWTGVVKYANGGVEGTIWSHRFRPAVKPVFPGVNADKYGLTFKGGFAPDKFRATAWITGTDLSCTITLTKRP